MLLFNEDVCGDFSAATSREWLETNGLGGYASSTIPGANTRRYHGLLVAALRPPVDRFVLLSKLEETLTVNGRRWDLSTNQYPGSVHPEGFHCLKGFRLDPYPIWTFMVEGVVLEKRLCMVHGENTTVVQYVLHPGDADAELEIRPLLAFRDFHSLGLENGDLDPTVAEAAGLATFRPYASLPPMHLAHDAAATVPTGHWYRGMEYLRELDRGQDWREDLFQPLLLRWHLRGGEMANLVASTEVRQSSRVGEYLREESERRAELLASAPLTESQQSNPLVRSLTLAADQFLVRRGEGWTVVAGYPWFSDWGRDTMIALPGLTLTTGRPEVAKGILLEFSRHVSQGMLPNRFPDLGEEPDYNTVDATLWYFEAVRALVERSGELAWVRAHLWEVLKEIVEWHVRGTRYGICMDADGLLRAGETGTQLTWMDAKVGDWVVTPRQGKAVEIQALWYHALRVMESLAESFGEEAAQKRYGAMAGKARRSFMQQFWNAECDCLYDVVDGDVKDDAIRPNQVLAVSLAHSMLPAGQARRVVGVVERELLTPVGLRSLAPSHPAYRGQYRGGVWERDGAYHQGTVWGWLMGPFLTAYVKVHGTRKARAQAEKWLDGFRLHLSEAGLGQVSEIFDGDPPHRPDGCFAQAWSVGEVLRVAVDVLRPPGVA